MAVLSLPERPEPAASALPTTAAAEFVDVSKVYSGPWRWRPRITAVQGVRFRVEPGEVFGLVGPNRAGKTTLVKLLLSLCTPTAGMVRRLGRPQCDRSTLARVGYLHENHAFPRYLGAAALLHFYGALSRVPVEKLPGRVRTLLDWVGLSDRGREPIAHFSKGMLQRLALAQALINEPDLLVLDEPTEGLDLGGRLLLWEAIAGVRARGGSVVLVSHALAEVEQVCDRVGVLVGGRLVYLGPLTGLTRASADSPPRPLEAALRLLYAGGGA
jgi:ABC-2 type transport system ATP-binding protein